MPKSGIRKWIFAASTGVVVLAVFLGWRGSRLALTDHTLQMRKRVHSEAHLAQELIRSRIAEFDTESFNVISAEYLQHASRATGPTAELSDSSFSAVGLLELKNSGFEPTWWSVNPKARDVVTPELLRQLAPEWQDAIRDMGRHLFIRAVDLKQAPLMVVLSRIELPNVQAAAIAVTALPPSAVKLNAQSLPEGLIFDHKGFIWGYQNPSYIGSVLKNDPIVRLALKSPEEEAELSFRSYGHARIGSFGQIADSNLYLGMSHEIPSLFSVLVNWWISIVIAVIGTAALSFAVMRWLLLQDTSESVEISPASIPGAVTMEFEPEVEEPDEFLPLPKPIAVTPAAVAEFSKKLPEPVVSSTPLNSPMEPKDTVFLDSVMHRALATFRNRATDEGVVIKETLAAGLQVKAKAAQLQTALEEIIKNALDAMRDVEVKRLIVETVPEGANARITVCDTGVGIPLADREKIFEPFFTTKSESSRGLGLTVVKRLLELVNGDSKVVSEMGKGTEFSLFIPMPSVHVVEPVPEKKSPIPSMPEFIDDEMVEVETMSVEKVRDIARHVEIRRPKVRMFD